MNYCQSFCRTIQRLCNSAGGGLPAEYQQVEYLQSTGSQWIDTGINNTTPIEYYVKVKRDGGNMAVFGTWNNNGRLFLAFDGVGNLQIGYSTSYYTGGYVGSAAEHEISGVLQSGAQTGYIDGTLSVNQSNTSAITPAATIPLFALRNTQNNTIYQYLTGRIYAFTLSSAGTKILDFVPCYRKSDSKPGMYDLVTNTFFTNAGSGEFTVGADVN